MDFPSSHPSISEILYSAFCCFWCPQNLLVIVCDGQLWWHVSFWVIHGGGRWLGGDPLSNTLKTDFIAMSPMGAAWGLLWLGFPIGIGSSGHVSVVSSLMWVLSLMVVEHFSEVVTFWNVLEPSPPPTCLRHPHCPISIPQRVTVCIVFKVQTNYIILVFLFRVLYEVCCF